LMNGESSDGGLQAGRSSGHVIKISAGEWHFRWEYKMATQTLKAPTPSRNQELLNWVEEMAALCKPDQVYWCNGSKEEYDRLCAEMVAGGTFIKLNPELPPGCFLARSHPSDVA